jgi:hypothetical protein
MAPGLTAFLVAFRVPASGREPDKRAGLPCSDLAVAGVVDHDRLEWTATKRMAAMLGMAAIG